MSTRCVVTFKDANESFAVYKHWDGYPENIIECIESAKAFAWELPRFEASDFAAAFIAANKKEGGNVYLSVGADYHGDLSYEYTVTCEDGQLVTTVKEKA